MERQKVLVLGGGDAGIGRAIAVLLKQMEQQVIVVDNEFMGLPSLSQINKLKPPKSFDLGFNKTDYTPNREYGWYRKFEKNGKKQNFKKAI